MGIYMCHKTEDIIRGFLYNYVVLAEKSCCALAPTSFCWILNSTNVKFSCNMLILISNSMGIMIIRG